MRPCISNVTAHSLKLIAVLLYCMSISMDKEDAQLSGSQYADFRHQIINGKVEEETGGGSADAVANVEILGDVGGLEPNEIAELVMIEVDFGAEYEGTSGTMEHRGAIGANFDSDQDIVSESENTGTVFNTNGTTDVKYGTAVGSEYFVQFRTHFENAKNVDHRQYFLRQNYGRGPVLDSQDTISVLSRIVNESTGVTGATYQMKLVWDIAETDDSGRRFSIPE